MSALNLPRYKSFTSQIFFKLNRFLAFYEISLSFSFSFLVFFYLFRSFYLVIICLLLITRLRARCYWEIALLSRRDRIIIIRSRFFSFRIRCETAKTGEASFCWLCYWNFLIKWDMYVNNCRLVIIALLTTFYWFIISVCSLLVIELSSY